MAARLPDPSGAAQPPEPAQIRFEELAELYRDAPVGLCLIDRELRHVHVNAAYARLFALEIDDLVGRSIAEALPEPARSRAIEMLTEVIEAGRPVPGREFRGRMPDDPGRQRFLWVNAHPLVRRGEVSGVMTAVYDVTDLRVARQAADERLRELESIYRNAPVGLSLVDRDLRYLRVNQAIADMNGVSIQQMLGRTYREMSPETADAAEPFLRRLMERGAPVRNREVRAAPPSDPGTEHVYLLNLDVLRGADGEVVGHMSAVQDVTELRRTEETARRRLRELETVYAHAPVGLCYLDPELRIVHLNQLYARLSPLPLEEQVGTLAPEVLDGPLAAQIVPQLRYVARTGTSSVGLEVRGCLPGPDSRRYTWIAQTHSARDVDGRVSGIISVLQDVTELAERRRESERVRDRLAEAQRVARVGSWEWDIVEGQTWWSSELREIFGLGPAHVASQEEFFERVHPDDRRKLRRQIERTLEDDRPYRVTFRIVRPDLSERTVFTAARLERDAGGRPVRMVGTCQDVTELGPREGS